MKQLLCVVVLIVCSACATNNATKGALTGSALGAGTGAIVGSQTGHAGAGVAVGAAIGAVSGALVGNAFDQQDQERRKLQSDLDEQQRMIEENKRLIDELKRTGADVYATRRGVVVNLPDVLFEFGKADLTPDARRTIADISKVIHGINREIAVEGHTDSVGSVMFNKRLSVGRAENVANELERHQVAGSKMRVRGFGEGNPIATNNTAEGRARNRRVEVIIENDSRENDNPIDNPNVPSDYRDSRQD